MLREIYTRLSRRLFYIWAGVNFTQIVLCIIKSIPPNFFVISLTVLVVTVGVVTLILTEDLPPEGFWLKLNDNPFHVGDILSSGQKGEEVVVYKSRPNEVYVLPLNK